MVRREIFEIENHFPAFSFISMQLKSYVNNFYHFLESILRSHTHILSIFFDYIHRSEFSNDRYKDFYGHMQ